MAREKKENTGRRWHGLEIPQKEIPEKIKEPFLHIFTCCQWDDQWQSLKFHVISISMGWSSVSRPKHRIGFFFGEQCVQLNHALVQRKVLARLYAMAIGPNYSAVPCRSAWIAQWACHFWILTSLTYISVCADICLDCKIPKAARTDWLNACRWQGWCLVWYLTTSM